jgi:hypothetical protein
MTRVGELERRRSHLWVPIGHLLSPERVKDNNQSVC